MKNKIIIIIISLIILLIFGGILIFTKTKNNQEDKRENYIKEEIKFVSAFTILNVCTPKISFEFDSDNKLEYKDLSKDFIVNTVYNYLYTYGKLENKYIDDEIMESFTKKDFINGFNEIFGFNKKIELLDTLTIMDTLYTYDEDEERYISYKENADCEDKYRSLYYLYDVNSNSDEIILKVAFYYPIFNGNEIYASANFLSEEKICIDKEIPNNLEYFKKFQFTIKKVRDKYQFDSISLIN